jgi:hypothetical protein
MASQIKSDLARKRSVAACPAAPGGDFCGLGSVRKPPAPRRPCRSPSRECPGCCPHPYPQRVWRMTSSAGATRCSSPTSHRAVKYPCRPVEVAFRARLYHNRELLVDERSRPAVFDPGTHILSPVFDRINFESTLEDVLSGVRSSLQRQMIQTGALPEGDYRLELGAEVLSGQRVNVIPGPGILHGELSAATAADHPGQQRTNVVMGTPVFSWSPVLTRTAGAAGVRIPAGGDVRRTGSRGCDRRQPTAP